jgi:hypothetical protein
VGGTVSTSLSRAAVRTTAFPKHGAQILDNGVRTFPGRKVPAAVVLAFKHDRAHGVVPEFRKEDEVLGEARYAQRDVGDVGLHGGEDGGSGVAVLVFVVDVQAGRGAGAREIVDADPGKDLVVAPGVVVSPVVEFFVEPGKEASRAGGEAVGEGEGFCGLEAVEGIAFFSETFGALKACFFVIGQWRGLGLGLEGWVDCGCWLRWGGGIDVVGFAVGWAILGGLDSCDGGA